jgi:hypothetical protein
LKTSNRLKPSIPVVALKGRNNAAQGKRSAALGKERRLGHIRPERAEQGAGNDSIMGCFMAARLGKDLIFLGVDLLTEPLNSRAFFVGKGSRDSFRLPHGHT